MTTDVLANDTGLGDTPITVQVTTPPGKGIATVNADKTITYKPNANENGPDIYKYTVTDADGQTSTATVYLQITPVNDAPVNSVPGPQTTDEDTALVFSEVNTNKISVSDVDAGNNPVEVTLGVDNGTLALSGTAGLNFSAGDGANDASMTFAGTIADINAALDSSRFDPAANYNGPAVLTIATDDQGHTGSGGAKSNTDTVDIAVRAVNDVPEAEAGSATTDEDSAKTITLRGSDADGDALTFGIASDATNGTLGAIGPVTCTGTVPKNCSADVTYIPNANYNGPDSFRFRVGDGTVNSADATVSITVDPLNDPPEIDLNGGASGTGYSATFAEGGGPVSIVDGNALTVADVDDNDLASATVKLTNLKNGNAESLAAGTTGTSITATYDATTGELSLNGAAPLADYQTVLRTVTYDNASRNPDTTGRSVTFMVNDGAANSNAATSTVAVNAVNDAPEVAFTAGPVQVDESGTVEHTYTFEITDPDSSSFSFATGYPGCGTGGELVGAPQVGDRGFRCRFPDGPASPTVKVKVEDSGDASSNEATRQVQVDNVAPTVTLEGPNSADEDSAKTYTYTVSDPGDDPNPAVDEGCGDNGTRTDTPEANSFECAFPDGPSSSTVVVRADDGDGIGTGNAEVTVANVAPTATLNNDGPIDEGSSATVSFSGQHDASAADRAAGFRYEYRCDGSEFTSPPDYATAGTQASKTCNFSGGGTKVVRARIIDRDGGFTAYTTGIQVNNLAPTISNIADHTTNEDTSTGEISFTVDDAGTPAADLRVTGGSSNTALVANSNIAFGGTGAKRAVKNLIRP